MKIFETIKLIWDGEEYSIKPTFELIQQVESKNRCSLMNLALRAFKQDTPITLAAEIYSALLQSININVSASEVFSSLDMTDIMQGANAFLNSCLPDESSNKKTKKSSVTKKS